MPGSLLILQQCHGREKTVTLTVAILFSSSHYSVLFYSSQLQYPSPVHTIVYSSPVHAIVCSLLLQLQYPFPVQTIVYSSPVHTIVCSSTAHLNVNWPISLIEMEMNLFSSSPVDVSWRLSLIHFRENTSGTVAAIRATICSSSDSFSCDTFSFCMVHFAWNLRLCVLYILVISMFLYCFPIFQK